MAIKMTGIVDMVMGSYNYYDTNKTIKEKDIALEEGVSLLNYNKAKAIIGASRFLVLGVAYGYANTSGDLLKLDAIGIGLAAAFTAGYMIEGVVSMFPVMLEDEAKNYKNFQGAILKNNEIFNSHLKHKELPLDTSYKLFMIGNKLATGNAIDKIVFKMKDKLSKYKNSWSSGQISEFNTLENAIYKLINKNEKLSNMLKSSEKENKLKIATNEIIKKNSDVNGKDNEFFKKMFFIKFPKDIRNEKEVKKKLQAINQEAILETYERMRQQNIELFFARVVLDYNKGIKHENVIEKFLKLQDVTSLPAKGDQKKVSIESYKNISKIAYEMKNNKKLPDATENLKDILNSINPNLVNKNKLKIYSFNEVFNFSKRKIIQKEIDSYYLSKEMTQFINKSNYNIDKDKKITFNEIDIDNKLFEEIVKIKGTKKDTTMNISKKENKKMSDI